MKNPMKAIDIPPVWLTAFICLAWWIGRLLPFGVSTFEGQRRIALTLAIAGVALTLMAAVEMSRAKTTIVPRRTPTALVTTGIFSHSRNPIYLSDVFILLAAILWFNAVAALILIPIFVRVLTKRFIAGEEKNLEQEFGEEFVAWTNSTRRWL